MSLNKAYNSSTQVASSTPFDNSVGDGYVGSDVQSVLQELRDYTIYDSQTTATTLNGTLQLIAPVAGGQDGGSGSTNTSTQFLTGSATGYTVEVPAATDLSVGMYYQIINQSSHDVTIKDGGGNVLFTLSQTSIGELTLQLNGTAAGTWVWFQTQVGVASGIIVYNVTSTTAFATSASALTLITGMSIVPQAGTYSIWFNASVTGSGSAQEIDCQIFNGATGIVDSPREGSTPAGSHLMLLSTQTTSQFNGTNACSVEVNANGNSMTVNQRSLLMIRTGT